MRRMVELTEEAHAAIKQVSDRSGRSIKDLVSTMVNKNVQWGDLVLSLILETAPPSLLADEAFWRQTEEALMKGMNRCREKYG